MALQPSAADSGDRQSNFRPLSVLLLGILIDLALRQPDPVERNAMLGILRKDGWL